ncbi:MAG TPA: hypothetical protein VNR70_08945 [Steroidobacteraceae bacterium]|nr:hypothetical protein [Steroidobacteraceae bacterium]
MTPSKPFVLALLCVSMAAWPWKAAWPAADEGMAEKLERDSLRCETHADLDACNEAIRRNSSDAVLLVAFADALMRAQRPADAIVQYRRAAALAPKMAGIAAKITAAEARLPRRSRDPSRRYSNAAPVAETH